MVLLGRLYLKSNCQHRVSTHVLDGSAAECCILKTIREINILAHCVYIGCINKKSFVAIAKPTADLKAITFFPRNVFIRVSIISSAQANHPCCKFQLASQTEVERS